jgi:hypothetical protein
MSVFFGRLRGRTAERNVGRLTATKSLVTGMKEMDQEDTKSKDGFDKASKTVAIVGLDENDLPCFEDLQNRKKCFVVYFAFDLLMLNGKDLAE